MIYILAVLIGLFSLQVQASQMSSVEKATIQPISKIDKQMIRAAANNQLEKLQKLLQDGADIDAKDKGDTALILAIQKGHNEVVEALLDAEADPDVQDSISRTALMHAARLGNKDSILLLLDVGADLTIKDNKGRTFDSIIKEYHPELLKDDDIKEAINAANASEGEEEKIVNEFGNLEIGRNYFYKRHAFERMKLRGITMADAIASIKYGTQGKTIHNCLRVGHKDKNIGIVFEPEKKIVITAISFNNRAELNTWLKGGSVPHRKDIPVKGGKGNAAKAKR